MAAVITILTILTNSIVMALSDEEIKDIPTMRWYDHDAAAAFSHSSHALRFLLSSRSFNWLTVTTLDLVAVATRLEPSRALVVQHKMILW
ncbi:hypothetical protein DFJ58DRAFT_246614 [Suillus subalutaceus]|uniref:uncharacterized protein n=1 Tax=Suillus subalutaceus TaxID=48586 RepID=UPI001B8652F5|nr:uncharacterized protein DFJ58DRAFT_246614 [Suillus subalutaceus]KAG1861778.1 hypothetical protein DFJ58DRAFT_246614 [Suillus subalutaceus]